VTDTEQMREMLDIAQQRWPDVHDRRQLLLRLAAAGREAIASEVEERARQHCADRQRDALRRASALVDKDVLLSDEAWV
jgi:DNA-binding MarR family transcriptional regulator